MRVSLSIDLHKLANRMKTCLDYKTTYRFLYILKWQGLSCYFAQLGAFLKAYSIYIVFNHSF